MSSVTIISGLPGNGKTLKAVGLMKTCRDEGRLVFAKNFAGLDPAVAEIWTEPLENWKSLPPGSVLFVDESQDFAASNGKGGSPDWVKDFSKVRHGGLEIVFVTQDPRFLDPWIRRLCNKHIHLMRKMGMELSTVHEWDRCQENPIDYHALQSSNKALWKFPRDDFALYKSANIHTVKRKLPKKLFLYLVVAVVTVGVIVYVALNIRHGVGGTPAAVANVVGGPRAVISAGEYAKRFTPLVKSMPWSAPGYADLKPTDFPVLSCMASDDRCVCITQQGTRYYLEDKTCRVVARDGVFNPFESARADKRKERDSDDRSFDRERRPSVLSSEVAPAASSTPSVVLGSSSSLGVGGRGNAAMQPPGTGKMAAASW